MKKYFVTIMTAGKEHPGELIREKTFPSFEDAKQQFRNDLAEKIGETGYKEMERIIDNYLAEHYPEDAPCEFTAMKAFLHNIIMDRSFPSEDDCKNAAFNFDDNMIQFGISPFVDGNMFYANEYETDEIIPPEDSIFPLIIESNVFTMDDENREYYFFATDNMNFGIEILLSTAPYEERRRQ